MKKITLLFLSLLAFTLNAQVTIWSDDFESYTPTNNVGEQTDVPAGYLHYDVDNDGIGWGLSNPANFTQPFDGIYLGNNFILSASFVTTGAGGNGGNGALSPNNILVLPMISIPSSATGVNLHYFVGSGTDPSFFSETYSVQVTTASDEASILAATPILDTTLAFQGGETVDLNLDAYIGMDVFISFRHYNTSDEWVIGLDDIIVDAATLSVDEFEQTRINHTFNNDTKILTLDADVYLNNLTVYNILGQQALKAGINNTFGEIDLSTLQAGIYIANIEGHNNASKTIKLVIK